MNKQTKMLLGVDEQMSTQLKVWVEQRDKALKESMSELPADKQQERMGAYWNWVATEFKATVLLHAGQLEKSFEKTAKKKRETDLDR